MAFLARKLLNRFVFSDSSEIRTDLPSELYGHAYKSDEETLTTLLGPFESYVVTAQSILIWEKPLTSFLVLVFVNVIFWLTVSCNCRFYFVLAAPVAFIHIYRTWTKQIWPEIRVPRPDGEDTEEWTPVNPQVLSVPEISRYLGNLTESGKQCYDWLMSTRQRQPGMFCVLVTSTLTVLALCGCYISGVFLAYLTIMTVMIGPGCFVHAYPLVSKYLISDLEPTDRGFDKGRCIDDDDLDLDEFLPADNQETLDILSKAGDAQQTDDESVVSSQDGLGLTNPCSEDLSLVIGLSDVPSYDNIDSDTDEGENVIDGSSSIPATLPPKPQHTGTEIKFVPCYFDDDDEDSDEEDETTARMSSEGDKLESEGLESRSNDSQVRPGDDGEKENVVMAKRSVSTTIAGGDVEEQVQVSRQNSSPSDGDASDYEIVSESELS